MPIRIVELEPGQELPILLDGAGDVGERPLPLLARGRGDSLEVGVDRRNDARLELVLSNPLERPYQARDRGLDPGPGAVTRLPLRHQPQPHRHLLGDLDPDLFAAVVDRAGATLVQDEPHALEDLGPVLHEPSRTEQPSGLLVRGGHEDDVAVQGAAVPVEGEERLEVEDAERLRVERSPAVHVAVPDLSREGRHIPVRRVGRDDVRVVKEEQRRLGATLQPSPDVPAAGRRLGRLVGDSLRLEDPGEELDRP